MSTPSIPTVTELGNVITNLTARRVIYGIYILAIVFVGAAFAYLSGVHADAPDWLNGTQSVIFYLGIPVGTLALANANKPTATAAQPQGD